MERMTMWPRKNPAHRRAANVGALIAASVLLTGVISGCGQATESDLSPQICQDPRVGCALRNGMSLQTRIAPAVLRPIDVTVRDVPTSVDSMRLEAAMVGMSMPPVGVELESSARGEWSGRLILPVCSQGRSDWLWTLVARVGKVEQRTHVQIEAKQP